MNTTNKSYIQDLDQNQTIQISYEDKIQKYRDKGYYFGLLNGAADQEKDSLTTIKPVEKPSALYFQLTVTEHARCSFSFSTDGVEFSTAGSFTASKGQWIGAKFGLVCLNTSDSAALGNSENAERGYSEGDWCLVEEI